MQLLEDAADFDENAAVPAEGEDGGDKDKEQAAGDDEDDEDDEDDAGAGGEEEGDEEQEQEQETREQKAARLEKVGRSNMLIWLNLPTYLPMQASPSS